MALTLWIGLRGALGAMLRHFSLIAIVVGMAVAKALV